MHLTVYRAIAFGPQHALGACESCGVPVTERRGFVYSAHCMAQLYCAKCQQICAESPVIDDIRQVHKLLADRERLAPGNVGGQPETLRRLLAR